MDDLGSAYSYETDNLNDLVMAGQLDSKAQNNMMRLTDVKEDEEQEESELQDEDALSDHMSQSFEEARSERRMSQVEQMGNGIGKDKKSRKKDKAKRAKNKKDGDKDKKEAQCGNYCSLF